MGLHGKFCFVGPGGCNITREESWGDRCHAGEIVAPVECLLNDVKILKKKVDSNRFSYKNDKGEDVFIVDKIFGQLNKYAAIGDIALQHHPGVVALVWAGFRLLLNVRRLVLSRRVVFDRDTLV
jgi:hypothetical protein